MKFNFPFAVGIYISFVFGLSAFSNEDNSKPEMIRMRYNNPGLIDDLAVGLWSWPIPADFNGDGNLDLIVNSECVPYNGVFRFENPGISAEHPGCAVPPESSSPIPYPKMPVFKPAGSPISRADRNLLPSWINGHIHILNREKEYPRFLETGMNEPVLLPVPSGLFPNGRGNAWKYVDFNGDGLTDLSVGTEDWSPYGWDNAFDQYGNWKNGKPISFVFIMLNRGTNEKPEYAPPFRLTTTDGKFVDTYAWPNQNFADFDQDGDLDLLCGEFIEKFTYFVNFDSIKQDT